MSLSLINVDFSDRNMPCFLGETDRDKYVKVFKAIRLQHILNDKPSLNTIEADRIISESMFNGKCVSKY